MSLQCHVKTLILHPVRASLIHRKTDLRRGVRDGYTLLEMLVVMIVISVLAALTAPSLFRLLTSESLDVATREFSNQLVHARAEAIAKRLPVRVVFATDWPDADGRMRRYSLWYWDQEQNGFVRTSKWFSLPKGVVFEASKPDYLGRSAYAQNDPGAIRCDFPLDHEPAALDLTDTGETEALAAQFVEFLPTGTARVPEGVEPQLIFVLIEGFWEEGENGAWRLVRIGTGPDGNPANWAQINLETLTGRVRIHRP
jgi:prepilin-type N-terminal cleavage/methylation domain-containing protein